MRRCEAAELRAPCTAVKRPQRQAVLLSLAAASGLLVLGGGLTPERTSRGERKPEGETSQQTAVAESPRTAGPEAERVQRVDAPQRAKITADASESTQHSVIATLHGLAAWHVSIREYAAAESLYQRALAIHEQQLGASRDELASSLDKLAALYLKQRRYVQSEALYEKAARGLLDGGVDAFLIETCQDLLQVKCAVNACLDALGTLGHVTQHRHGHAYSGALLLYASRVGYHQFGGAQ